MISIEWQVMAALVLDAFIGDPRSWPHPVRLMGWMAMRLEPITRRSFANARVAGLLTALTVIAVTGVLTYGVVQIRPCSKSVDWSDCFDSNNIHWNSSS